MSSVEELKNDPFRPLILDIGSDTFRLGFAGDDFPQICAKSVYVNASDYLFSSDVINGLEDLFFNKEKTQTHLFGDDALKYKHILKVHEFKTENNFNILSKFFQHYYSQLDIAPEYQYKQPIVIIAPFLMTDMQKSKLQQIFFDTLKIPRLLFLSESQATMAPLQKISAVVINMGDSLTYINSFLHGFNKLMSRDTFPVSGKDLTNYLLNLSVTQKGSEKKNYIDELIAKEIKEKTSICVLNADAEKKRIGDGVTKYDKIINLPDGNSLKIDYERFMLSEPLFDPTLLHIDYFSIAEAIANVIKSWDRENWEELISNIILSGGGSLIPGLKDRLKVELQKHFPEKINPKINIIAVTGREHMSWIGASLLFLKKQLEKGWIENPIPPNPPSPSENTI